MRPVGVLAAEGRKLVTLPGVWAALAVGVGGSVAVTALNAATVRGAYASGESGRVADASPFEAALAGPMILVGVAAVVIGVFAMSSEYTPNRSDAGGGRQITATLTAAPRRVGLLLAKAVVVMATTLATTLVALAASYLLARTVIGGYAVESVGEHAMLTRAAGTCVYMECLAVLAFAISVLARSGLVPLTVLVVNVSVVPFSLLLSRITPLANWLPDAAGRNLFGLPADYVVPGAPGPLAGGIAMGAWALVLLAAAGVAFARRDA